MKKLIYVWAILACVACNSAQSRFETQMQAQAEMVLSRSADAFTGVSLDDEDAFSIAFAEMEASLDEAYDSFESDDDRQQFSEYLSHALDESDIDEEILWKLMQQIADKNKCSGLTVSGGDPMEQPDSLLLLLEKARSRFKDILVYTGFSIEDILKGCASEAGIKCLDYIDVLIDGRYVKELNTSDCVLRGSSNQKITYLNEKMKPIYEEYMKQGRIVETFTHNQETIITGILNEVTDYE